MQSHDPERANSHSNSGPASETRRSRIVLVVPRTLVKTIKDVLETHGKLDKHVKISPSSIRQQDAYLDQGSVVVQPDAFLIPTKLSIEIDLSDSDTLRLKRDFLQSLGLIEYEGVIGAVKSEQLHGAHGISEPERGCNPGRGSHQASSSEDYSIVNPLARTMNHWLQQLPLKEADWPFSSDIVLSYSWTYMIYPPLLLLPPSTLSNLTSIFGLKGQSLPIDLSSLWYLLSKEFKTSHIAMNAPILASVSEEISVQDGQHQEANILRSPTGLTPLYGEFGPALPLTYKPTATDLSSAFWCTARQNGMFQTWAPRYTMFSRGNISEKARILSLKALKTKELGCEPQETSAVDLYSGIGYFAFSYAKAGVGKVLCWDINPWSIEGLKRGAKENRWSVNVIKNCHAFNETFSENERFIVFEESNEHAARRVNVIRDIIPPVRHVNCGLLPSSKDSWEIAVQVLDPIGGWIHAHENIAQADIETRKLEIVEMFTLLVKKYRGQGLAVQWKVECENLERVKSYAPGVMHCVLDIAILPTE